MEVKVHITVSEKSVDDFLKVLDKLKIKYQCFTDDTHDDKHPVKVIDIQEILSNERESMIKNTIKRINNDL